MKQLCYLLFFVTLPLFSQVGIGTETPNATLEIKSTNEATPANNDGLLIPKVEEFPVTNPGPGQDGMLVYATGSGSVAKGFYFWDNGTTAWVLATGAKNIDDLSDGSADGTGSSVFLGIDAGLNDDGTNNQNTSIGYQSLLNNTSGPANTAIGHWSLRDNSSGNGNTAVGHYAGRANITGIANTMLGAGALYQKTAGDNNLAIGGLAGGSLTSGSGNIFIGHRSAFAQTSTSNKLYIENSDAPDPLIYGEFDNDILRANGTFQIGTPGSGGYAFPQADGTNAQLFQTDGNGNLGWVDYDAVGIQRIDHLIDGRSDNVGYSVHLGQRSGENTVDLIASRSVGVGFETLQSNTSGTSNVALGFWSMLFNTTGSHNTAIGQRSLIQNTIGSNNIAIGSVSLTNNTSGNDNTAVGYVAMGENTTGQDNSAFGFASLYNNTIGNDNVSIGHSSLYTNVDGDGNVAIGKTALYENSSGSYNSATGFEALRDNDTGDANVANGYFAMRFNTDGNYNVGIGNSALYSNVTGYRNTALGSSAGVYSTGNDNMYLGNGSGYWISSGSNNVLVGARAGAGTAVHSKSGSVFLGYEAGENELNSNRLYIDNSNTTAPLIYGEFDNDLLGVNGALGVGHQAPQVPLHVENAGTGGSQTIVAALESNSSNRPVLQFSESSTINLSSGMSIEYNGAGSGSANKMAINAVGGTSLFEFENGGDLTVLSGDLIIDGLGSDREIKITDSGGNPDRVLMRQDVSQDIFVGDIDNNGGDTYIRAGGSTELSVISGTGFVGVNTISPSWTFEVNGNAAKPGGSSWINSSDRRLKQDIRSYTEGLEKILQINPVTYRYNSLSGFDTSREHVGVIAQELQKVVPYMVQNYEREGKEFLAVDNSSMTYMLINAVKEQQQLIDELKQELIEIKNLLKTTSNE